MAKKEENIQFDLSDNPILIEVDKSQYRQETSVYKEKNKEKKNKSEELINPLRNERVEVKFLPKVGKITDPKHVLYGNMADTAYRIFVTPRLSSGHYVNVLTDSEKEFLEDIMGLEYNALSIYKKDNNFWDGDVDNPISRVKLYKYDNYLDLSNPEDYIKYKILLANKNTIAPSIKELQDRPKATYLFVIIRAEEEHKQAKDNMSNTMKCYKEFGKIEDNADKLGLIIETIEGKKVAPGTNIEFLQTKINSLIQSNSKLFLQVVTDPLLDIKVLIKKCVDNGIISTKGNGLYLRENNMPLCEHNEDPTFNVAANFLSSPKRQDLLFSLQNKINK